jgi:hypothetical protein
MVDRFDGDRVLNLIASSDLDAAQVLLDEAAEAAVAPWADMVTPEDFEVVMLGLTGAESILEAAAILIQPEGKRGRVEANLCQALVANRREDGAALLRAIVEALDDCLALDDLSDETFEAFSNLTFVARASDPFQQWRIAMNAARTFRERGDARLARTWIERVPVEAGDSDIVVQVYSDLRNAIEAMDP